MERQIQVRLDASPGEAVALLDRAISSGWAAVELAGDADALLRLDESEVFRQCVVPAMESNQLTCGAFWIDGVSDGCLADDDPSVRRSAEDQLAAIIESAARFSGRRVSVAPATVLADDPRRVNYQDALNRTADVLEALAPTAEAAGVQLCVRASVAGFLTSPPELRELLDRVNSHAVGVDLDTVSRSAAADWRDWFATLGPYVGALGVDVERTIGSTSAADHVDSILARMRAVSILPRFDAAIVCRAIC